MKIQFLVEGYLEKDFLKKVCSGVSAKKIVKNSKTAPVTTIAECVVTHVRLAQQYNRIPVIIFDREKRPESPDEFRDKLLQTLAREHEVDIQNVHVFIADRAIENWIIAAIDDQIADADSVTSPKRYLKEKLGRYRSLTNGPTLLKKGVPSRMAEKSASFRYLYENFPTPVKDCWWLDKEDKSN